MKKIIIVISLFALFSVCMKGCTFVDYINVETPEEQEINTTPTPNPTPIPAFEPSPEPTPEPTPVLPQETPMPPEPVPSFGFIDAHADTISKAIMLDPGEQGLFNNSALDVDFKRLSEFDAPVQVFVAWCSNRWVSTAFDRTNQMFDFFEQEVEKHSDLIEIALDLDDIKRIAGERKISAILAIEGGEALMGKIENVDHFYERGVRILAPTWNRENELGFGQGSGTEGLKSFGIEVIKRMDELGMILDVSHLNEASFWDAHNTSTRPYMASHSNAYSIFAHSRNLKDDQILAIVESGGIIGFNMYPEIITEADPTMNDIMTHFRHFISIGAGNHIALGCDLDGIPSKPQGITDVSSLKTLRESLTTTFNPETSKKIMETNFYEFFTRYFTS
ncbi:MAG: dipeptidase [Oscillospiraceae bacterium]|nr:dipeptidase [Oscillospiraceae bacterium]